MVNPKCQRAMKKKERKRLESDVNFLVGHLIIRYEKLEDRLVDLEKTAFSPVVKEVARQRLTAHKARGDK